MSEQYLVLDPKAVFEAAYCRNEQALREAISQFGHPSRLRIFQITDAPDVTADFIQEPETPDEEADNRAYQAHRAWQRSQMTRVL